MISLATAQKLKAAGLNWAPALFDLFAIPDRSMDDKVFVISDMLVTVDILQGLQVVSFQGASEWALDSLVTADTVWLPSEAQLRQAVESGLLAAGRSELRLLSDLRGYICEFYLDEKVHSFEAGDASEAYASALLFLLEMHRAPHSRN
ncbi:MAG TPA: hypothetical protein VF823_01210 [Anaerolineales bacterium]